VSLKINQFRVAVYPTRYFILASTIPKIRKIWRLKLRKIAGFDYPAVVWSPPPRNSHEYRHKPYTAWK